LAQPERHVGAGGSEEPLQETPRLVVREYRGRIRARVTRAFEDDAAVMVAAGFKPVREAWSGGGLSKSELEVTYEAGPNAFWAVPARALAPGEMSEGRSRLFWSIVLMLVALAALLALAAVALATLV
jgi:hypothetical protein